MDSIWGGGDRGYLATVAATLCAPLIGSCRGPIKGAFLLFEVAMNNQDVFPHTRENSGFYPWEESMPDRFARPRNPFVPFPRQELEQSIVQRFEKTVMQVPNRLAIKDGDRSFTYQELNERANRVAWAILAGGEGGAPTVALLAERGAPAIAALMGILKAGKAYVPLDPTYPLARLEYMLRDSRSDLILAGDENVALARELATRTRAGGAVLWTVVDTGRVSSGCSACQSLMPGCLPRIPGWRSRRMPMPTSCIRLARRAAPRESWGITGRSCISARSLSTCITSVRRIV